MGKEAIQVKAEEDGCVYIYNFSTGTWLKLCDVKSPSELPNSVRRKIQEVQRSMTGGKHGNGND